MSVKSLCLQWKSNYYFKDKDKTESPINLFEVLWVKNQHQPYYVRQLYNVILNSSGAQYYLVQWEKGRTAWWIQWAATQQPNLLPIHLFNMCTVDSHSRSNLTYYVPYTGAETIRNWLIYRQKSNLLQKQIFVSFNFEYLKRPRDMLTTTVSVLTLRLVLIKDVLLP